MTRLADRNAIAQGHSRSSGRLSSDEKRLLQSSHSNRSEKVQTQNERHKQSRKTTFQTVANNQENQVLVIVVINMIYLIWYQLNFRFGNQFSLIFSTTFCSLQ